MPIDNIEPQIRSKRPSDSAFKQQRLPAWQPILTAGTVLPTFFVIGIAFIPVGIGLLYFSDEVKELVVDYTDCNMTVIGLDQTYSSTTSTPCSTYVAENPNLECICNISFTLETDFQGKVYIYYGLSNYYQNHRRYVKSRDDNQLLGRLSSSPSSDCLPFATDIDNQTGQELPIAPCGAIANSLFNDTLTLYRVSDSGERQKVPVLRTGIAWKSDREIKFRNPYAPNGLQEAFKGFTKPRNWHRYVWELDPEDPNNNGFQNEDLIVWMRTAALPTFRKLYRRIDHNATGYKDGLIRGNYELFINYTYDVSDFNGAKRMILSTTSLIGGKNPFLGIAYIVVGCICLLLGITLLFIHIKCGKSTSEMINVNPRTPWTAQ